MTDTRDLIAELRETAKAIQHLPEALREVADDLERYRFEDLRLREAMAKLRAERKDDA